MPSASPPLLVVLLALLLTSGLWAQGVGAPCPPADPLPQSHAPIAAFDPQTVVLGSFDDGLAMVDAAGVNALKVTYELDPTGIFGTQALRVPDQAAVGIYRLPQMSTSQGTIEMWVRPGPDPERRVVLFSIRGRRSLDANGFNDLVVGETSGQVETTLSKVFFDTGNGLDLGNPMLFESVAPRGISIGDVDGDARLDMVVSMNYGDTLAGDPDVIGEVHVLSGPLTAGTVASPSQVIEVTRPQGNVLVDLDDDGDLDLLVASFSETTPPVVGFENVDGVFGVPTTFSIQLPPSGAEGMAVGDVDGDGLVDVLFANLSPLPSAVLLGQQTAEGYLLGGPDLEAIQPRSSGALGASLADLNDDGWLDVVLAQPGESDGQLAIHLNRGGGQFSPDADCLIPTPRPFIVSAVRDVNNDGHLDLVVANWRQGATTTPFSSVFHGPLVDPTRPPGPQACLPAPVPMLFPVQDAVSVTIGDLDRDGIDDLFFRSSTSTNSHGFFLDIDGGCTSVPCTPDLVVTTEPTIGNPAGEGAGVYAAVTGTTAYGSVLLRPNSFELSAQDGVVTFTVFDTFGMPFEVSAPLPDAGDPAAVDGFHHVQAEWRSTPGVVELRVGDPTDPANTSTLALGKPLRLSTVDPLFRLGSDVDNQRRARGWSFDDVRISRVRRSELDGDDDDVMDGWDNCPLASNAAQADSDDDGVGDACTVCQPDLGFGGPGDVTIALCGQSLACGNSATFSIEGALPNSIGFVLFGPNAVPVPFKGGMLVPSPVLPGAVQIPTGPAGALSFPLLGIGGPLDVVVQLVVLDPTQPAGFALSNALMLTFLR